MILCAACKREIYVGSRCFQIARGVMGTQRFVYSHGSLFCSEDCLDAELLPDDSSDIDDNPPAPRPRRVP